MSLLEILGNVLVFIEMLNMLVMGVINMSRQFFNMCVGVESRSHDFDDELKIIFLISSSDTRSKTFILDIISLFALVEYSVLYLRIWNE